LALPNKLLLRCHQIPKNQCNSTSRFDCSGHGTSPRSEEIIASFCGSEIVARWEEVKGCLVAVVVPEEADRAQEVYLHEQVEYETGHEISSDNELDEMVSAID
jgi:hypothetical protein